MKNTKKLSIAIIGGGYMGLHHLKRIRELVGANVLENVSVEIVCDKDLDRCREIKNKYGIQTTDSPEKAISSKNCNVIIIATPTSFHKEQVELAIYEKKPFYCEKPLGLTLDESEEMTKLVTDSGLNNQVGLCFRYSPNVCFINKLITGGKLGKPLFCNYREDSSFPFAGIYKTSWRANKTLSGGGILHEENIHDIDCLLYLFGDFESENVRFGSYDKSINMETYVEGTFQFNSGVRTRFQSMWHPFEGRGSSRRIEIFCENGMIMSEFFFEGDLSYKIHGQEPMFITGKELAEIYFENHGLDLKYHHIHQKYGTLAILSFLSNLQNDIECEPNFKTALEAERKVFQVYQDGAFL